MKCKRVIIFLVLIAIFLPFSAPAQAGLGSRLSGRIVLNVERNGEAWYIWPQDNKRYFLGRPADAFQVMRKLGLGINNTKLASIEPVDRDKDIGPAVAGLKISSAATSSNAASLPDYDKNLTRSLAGRILLQVENNGEAWYVNPSDLKRYYLGRPEDAFRIMRELSLGISRENLALIHKPGMEEALDQYSRYEHKKITTVEGVFTVDAIEIDLAAPGLKIITDTADPYPSPERDKNRSDYGARSLAKFATEHNAFAGINGTYFCSGSGCSNYNYYFYPVYDTVSGKLINESELKYWTTGPIFAFDTNNKFYYFKDSREFKSVKDFEDKYGVKLQAAIGNKPRLIQDSMNYLIEWELDKAQVNSKVIRNAVGYKNNKIYLVVAYGVTMQNLGTIMQAMGMEYALNLDGGYSAALWYNDEYMVGPGRNIPNVLLFAGVK